MVVAILVTALVGLVAAAATFWAMQPLGDPAPLGAVLPAVPQLYEVVPDERLDETSVVEGRIAEVFLELLAAQPDGAPPLRYPVNVEIVDFKIWHPYATQTAAFGPAEVSRNDVLVQGDLLYDQPLRKLMYSMPHRIEGESVTVHMSRLRHELDTGGATFYADVAPLALDGYRFEHFEYFETLEPGEQLSHYLFIGPLGPKRVLRMDFVTSPELHERARSYVFKIMRSFKAGPRLAEGALTYDAAYLALNELAEE